VLAERKMKQEEEEVDILTGNDAEEVVEHPRVNGDEEDIAWADDEPDEDVRGWKMKIVMEDELDMI
jgi:COMPASS component SWD1